MPAPRVVVLPTVLLLVAFAVTSCGVGSCEEDQGAIPAGGSGTATAMSEGERAWAMAALDLINVERALHGLAPLVWDEDAARAAYAHSYDMDRRDFFAHVNPDGARPGDRLHAQGVAYAVCAENIARGYDTPEALVAAWMASPGHRLNVIDPLLTHAGIGVHTRAGDGPWWTEDLFR